MQKKRINKLTKQIKLLNQLIIDISEANGAIGDAIFQLEDQMKNEELIDELPQLHSEIHDNWETIFWTHEGFDRRLLDAEFRFQSILERYEKRLEKLKDELAKDETITMILKDFGAV